MKEYVAFLELLGNLTSANGSTPDPEKVDLALDGQAGSYLRKVVPLKDLRSQGAFFTGSDRAQRLIEKIPPHHLQTGLIVDPQCGAGNLLLAAARLLPVKRTPQETIRFWGTRLGGLDIDEEFVEATKTRLWLLAIQRCGLPSTQIPDLNNDLPLVRKGDSFNDCDLQKRADVLLLNPPYGRISAHDKCTWTRGSVSAAAVFVEDALRKCKLGCLLATILPDALRSGSRYRRWRHVVESLAALENVELGGIFDAATDIDVFTAISKRSEHPHKSALWFDHRTDQGQKIGDQFNVHVGPVVPFRHVNRGPWYPYLTINALPRWKSVREIVTRRRFPGTTFSGPFVAIRRVSRVGDKFRAVGTIINVDDYIAVENHIIVCLPKDGSVVTCKKLIRSLKHASTSEWLNRSICCRHLTTTSVRETPLFC
jgi:hypothetical protein